MSCYDKRSVLRRSFRPLLFVGFPEGYQIFYAPQPICDASGHCRRHAQCTMNLDEVVSEICEGNRSRVILQLARESITQARVAPTIRSQCPVLPFDIAGADVFRVWVPAYDFHVATDAAGRRVTPRIFIRGCAVDFLQLAVHYPRFLLIEGFGHSEYDAANAYHADCVNKSDEQRC